MWKLIKLLIYIFILSALALTAYAYLGPFVFPHDFSVPTQTTTQSLPLGGT